jgi:hypothetical protein
MENSSVAISDENQLKEKKDLGCPGYVDLDWIHPAQGPLTVFRGNGNEISGSISWSAE